ncbi:hypothetical protein MMC27_002948 [Xylographa pallens]|nr:hypothetical protein [Xylographa pallens]
MSFALFANLPLELQALVISHCKPSDHAHMVRTSRAMLKLSLPILYRDIDISIHNQPGKRPSVYIPIAVEADDPSRSVPLELDAKLHSRQQTLIRTLLRKPQYGALVRSLTWTRRTCFNAAYEQLPEQRTWTAFLTMCNVQTVDFVSLATERELDSPPLRMFPTAQMVRLGGVFSSALLRSICHGVDPAKLRTLALDNLHDLGQARDGHDLPRASDLSTRTETDCADGTPMLRHPGPTRGCLRPLIGRCTALQHLSLRSVGQDDVHDALWSPAKDEARYAEAAEFIASVRPTLRTLVFEQGLQADDDSDPGCGSSRAGLSTREAGRPMDVRFVKYIVPVLVEASWPHLREMVIRGVGGSVRRSVERGNREMDRTLAEEMYGIVHGAMSEQNIRLSWERETSKTFYMRVHDLRYD